MIFSQARSKVFLDTKEELEFQYLETAWNILKFNFTTSPIDKIKKKDYN